MQEFMQRIRDLITSCITELVHTLAPGTVSRSKENSTASVNPDLKVRMDDGTELSYPPLNGIAIWMPVGNGGETGFCYPVKKGDKGILLFPEGGNGMDMKYDISRAIFLAGKEACSKAKTAGEEECAYMFAPGSIVAVGPDSVRIERNGVKVKLTDSSVEITSPTVTISGDLRVDGTLKAGGINMNTHTHVGVHGPTQGPQ